MHRTWLLPRPDRDLCPGQNGTCAPAGQPPSGPGQNGRRRCKFVTDMHDLTVTELAAVPITAHYLNRPPRLNADVGAFLTATAQLATRQAAAAEKAVAQAPTP